MIDFAEVSYSYGKDALLSDVSMQLGTGSFHFLTGPSGAGKTTLLRLCYADLVAQGGQVSLFGQDAATLSRDDTALIRRRIGVVHQDCQFLDHLPLRENIALPLRVSGQPLDEASLDELLGWVGLDRHADSRPPQLSGGERQRAALARAVVMSPDMIIADEPTGNLDWDMSMRLLTLLTELNKMGKTVLIATHDLTLIRAAKSVVAARVLRIRDRQVQFAGSDL